jgi:hypothetical protein
MNHIDFEISAFDPSGMLMGTRTRRTRDLSGKWLSIASSFLAKQSGNPKAGWGGPLGHLETQLTSSDGCALAMFFAHGVLVSSMALLSGRSRAVESSILTIFVQSLRKSKFVQEDAINEIPFADIFQLSVRPHLIVIPWGDERVAEQDAELIQELALHLGAAYLQGTVTDP